MASETKNIFRIHLGLVIAETLCIPAFIFELYRDLQGNQLSWAYVFEWPILGIYAIHMWRRMLREERGAATPAKKTQKLPEGKDSPEAAWDQFLAGRHETAERSPEEN